MDKINYKILGNFKEKSKRIFLLDNKAIFYWIIFYIILFTYNIVRTLFVTNTNDLFAISEGVIYIQMIREIFLFLLISPSMFLFKNSKMSERKIFVTFIFFGVLVSFILLLINIISILFIANQMININDELSLGKIYTFIITSILGSICLIFMYIFVAIFTYKKDYKAIMILMVVQTLILILFDIVFLSNWVFNQQNIFGVSLSNFLGPFTSMLLGFIWISKKYSLSFKELDIKNIWKIKENKKFMKQSTFIGLEGLIRQIVYIFVTLGIMNNLGPDDWSSWNLSMNIFFSLFVNLSFAIQMGSYSRYSENKIDSKKILYSSFIYMSILVVVLSLFSYPLFNIFLPWNSNNQDFTSLAIKTSWIMLIPIFIMMYSSMLIPYFNSNGMSKLYFTNQLIMLPMNIIMLVLLQLDIVSGNYFIASLMFIVGILFTSFNYSLMFFYNSRKTVYNNNI